MVCIRVILLLRDPSPEGTDATCWIVSMDRLKQLQFLGGAPKETSKLDVGDCSP